MADKTDDQNNSTGNDAPAAPAQGGDAAAVAIDPQHGAADQPPRLVEPEAAAQGAEVPKSDYVDEYLAPETPHQAGSHATEAEPVRAATVEPAREQQAVHEAPAAEVAPVYASAPAPATTASEEPTAEAPQQQQHIVYINAPQRPKKKSNRGFGALMSLLATVAFVVALVVTMAIVYSLLVGNLNLGFLAQAAFYVPVGLFFAGMLLLALILNRANWWTYVIGSAIVALIVYFGTIGVLLLSNIVVFSTPARAAELFRQGLVNEFTIAAALVAREVALWTGAIIASRGRKVKARNADAQAEFEREQAENRSR